LNFEKKISTFGLGFDLLLHSLTRISGTPRTEKSDAELELFFWKSPPFSVYCVNFRRFGDQHGGFETCEVCKSDENWNRAGE